MTENVPLRYEKNKASTEYSACIHEGKAELASLALAYL